MRIGVDSKVIIAAVHANHPRHAVSSDWLEYSIVSHELIIAHHSILETYAVLTRMPSDFRVTPTEAKEIIKGTVYKNISVADFTGNQMWEFLDEIIDISAFGGQAYDAFIMEIMKRNEVEGFATYNASHFEAFRSDIRIIEPGHSR